MIKFNDRFEFERDKYCWHLHEWRVGQDKGGDVKMHRDTTYYPNIQQLCVVIIDRSLGGCESLEEMIKLLEYTVGVVQGHYEPQGATEALKTEEAE